MEDRPLTPLLAGKRVLIAEDSHAQQRILSFLLGKAGMIATLVENGQEAIDRASREPFDAILLDMQMPEVDGYEAASRLRQLGYGGPIVALTADTFRGDEQRCVEAGCDDYLAKPVQPAELLGLLRRLLATTGRTATVAMTTDDIAFQALLSEYVGGMSERMRNLRAALTAEDRTTLMQLAHKMRGAAAMYGLTDLAEMAGLIEDAVREGQDRDLLAELVGEMEEETRRLGTR